MPPSSPEIPAAFTKPAASASKNFKRKSSILSVAVTALVVPGLFATLALPAYAYSPPESTEASEATAALTQLKETNAQSVQVADDVAAAPTARDAFAATSVEELAAANLRAQLAAQYSSYSGPSVSDFLANPPYPNFSLDQVAAVALQYQGVPYVYGGSSPAGFDCSGLVMFVYAQFGISLPHSSSAQGSIGTAIDPAAALPGDVVVLDGGGHVGIYLGNGQMIDAPYEGKPVLVRAIYSSDYYIVRFGI
ncbi:MAG: C40 family peptidase [Rhodoglobus sp.]